MRRATNEFVRFEPDRAPILAQKRRRRSGMRVLCSSPRMRARAKPKCWSIASRAYCFLAHRLQRFCASPTPRRRRRGCSGACSNTWGLSAIDKTLADDLAKLRRAAVEAFRSQPGAWTLRPRTRNAGRIAHPDHSRVLRATAGAVSAGSRASRRASTSRMKRAPGRCSHWRGRMRCWIPIQLNPAAFVRFATRLHAKVSGRCSSPECCAAPISGVSGSASKGAANAGEAIRARHDARVDAETFAADCLAWAP